MECPRLIAEAQKGNGTVAPERLTVGDYLEQWLRHIRTKVSPKSFERYTSIVRANPIPALGNIRLSKLQPLAISSAYSDALTHRRSQAEELLKIGVRLTDDTFVCARKDGKSQQPNSISHGWTDFLAATKLPRIRFHDLRHSHATLMLRANVHPKIVSERLGHSKVAITLDTYSHVIPGMQQEAAAAIDAAFGGAAKD